MKIAIVEDEAVIARRLERMIRQIVGDAVSIDFAPSLAAARTLNVAPVDLVFLDLNLDGNDGFRVVEEAVALPSQTVIVSAHHDQAIRAFDYGVADFIAKPWTEERLRLAIERATGREPTVRRANVLVVRKACELRSIRAEHIVFIRGADDYAELHLDDGSVHLHSKSLSALETILPSDFARVHRSYIVNLSRVQGLRATALVLDDGSTIPVGRIYRGAVRERVMTGSAESN